MESDNETSHPTLLQHSKYHSHNSIKETILGQTNYSLSAFKLSSSRLEKGGFDKFLRLTAKEVQLHIANWLSIETEVNKIIELLSIIKRQHTSREVYYLQVYLNTCQISKEEEISLTTKLTDLLTKPKFIRNNFNNFNNKTLSSTSNYNRRNYSVPNLSNNQYRPPFKPPPFHKKEGYL